MHNSNATGFVSMATVPKDFWLFGSILSNLPGQTNEHNTISQKQITNKEKEHKKDGGSPFSF